MIRKIILFSLFMVLLLGLAGCAKSPSKAYLYTHSVSNLNDGRYGSPTPVKVTVYQLKHATAFDRASYTALTRHSSTVLGDDLIDTYGFIMYPNQRRIIEIKLSPETNFLGFVASYRHLHKTNWQKIIKVASDRKDVVLKLKLDADSYFVRKQPWKR